MPILDIQRRLAQTGRIRIGESVVGERADGSKYTRPKKSETFRLTSSSKAAIDAVAAMYGGTPHEWKDAPTSGQWELMTMSTTLKILIPPESVSFSQFYELWSGGGCQRRCNGAYQVPSEDDCVCDPNDRECKPHTRLSVMLADLPGAGLWRLDTQGWNAANEMSGAFELAQLIAKARGIAILPGVLRLDQRETKRPNPKDPTKTITRKFAVPVIDFDLDLGEIARGTQVAIETRSPITPVADDEPTPSIAEQLESINTPAEKKLRANAAEPVKSTGIKVRPRGAVREDDDGEPKGSTSGESEGMMATDEQREELARLLGKVIGDVEREDVRDAWKFQNIPPVTQPMTIEQLESATRIVRKVLPEREVEPMVKSVTVNANDILPPKAPRNKITQLNIKFEECGFGDREIIHEYCARVIGVPNVKSLNDLTKPQVELILQQLVADAEG